MVARPDERERDTLIERMQARGLRLTSQRRVVAELLEQAEEHLDAESLYLEARRRDPSIHRATVYRTLPLLTESGLVHEMDFGKDYKIYDPNYADHPNHNHIICDDCDKIVEFESDRLDQLENEISNELGFKVKSQQLRINASCEEMKRLGACKNKGQ